MSRPDRWARACPIGVGVALAGKQLDQLPYRVWVLCGDSEMAEGSMFEALEHAAHAGLDNLIAIVDVNRLGQTGETMHGWDLDSYLRRAQAAGWHGIAIDGHDVAEIDRAYTDAVATELRPTMIVARTEKGHGVTAVANQNGFHGKPLADPEAAIAELGGLRSIRVTAHEPDRSVEPRPAAEPGVVRLPAYEVGTTEATRRAYGDALAAIGSARAEVVALDGEVSNSTYAEVFREAHPDRYFEMYIAEQQLVAAAIGMQVRGWRPFASTFAAFFTRAYDFIRMAAVSRATLSLVGSHAGVSIGEDGPSQMALEDLAMMRAVHGSTVLYPSDANQAAALVAAMVDRPGISFLRTTREKTPVIYPPGESFPIGGARVVRSSDADDVTLVGAGITLHQAIAAADALAEDGHHGAGHRPVQHQAHRRGHPARGRRRHRSPGHGRGPLGRGRPGGRRARGVRRRGGSPADLGPGCPHHAGIGDPGRTAGRCRHRRDGDCRCRPGAGCRRDADSGRRSELRRYRSVNTLQRLHAEFGQSPWIDSIDRELIDSGGLSTMIGDGIRGLTSNPTIFAKAVAAGYYDELVRSMHEDGADGQAIYEAIAVGDIRDAADLLRPVYDGADGADGLASIEVEPALADDGDATLRRARELWSAVDKPNIFVKIPATTAGLPAIEAATAEGINVNITLMFSVDVYRDVARAYLAGLRRFRDAGGDVSRVASVASFFVSRVDTKVDKLLDALGTDAAAQARGTAAVANAQLAYQAYGEIFGGSEFADLRAAGARGPALPVGEHLDQGPDLPRREVRRGAHRSGHGGHHAPRDDRGHARPRRAATDAGRGLRRGRGRHRRHRGPGHLHAAGDRRAHRRGRGRRSRSPSTSCSRPSSTSGGPSPPHDRSARRRRRLAARALGNRPRRGAAVGA